MNATTEPQEKPKRKSPLLVILSVLGGCCVLLLAIGFIRIGMQEVGLLPTDTPRPTATATPVPTDTPLPTNTPLPTSTSVPTETPQPTDTPTDEPTPTRTPTEAPTEVVQVGEIPLEIQLYALQLGEKTQTMAGALQELSALSLNPRLGDENWVVAMATQIVIIRLAHEEITAMDVPPEMAEIHAAVLDAISDCNDSTEFLVSGLDNGNVEDIETAAKLMAQCGSKMAAPSEMIVTYIAEKTGTPVALVTNEPITAPTDPPAPANTPVPPTNTPVPPTQTAVPVPAAAEIGVDKALGAWGLKLYDVKRAKAVWFYGDGTHAQGVWFIPFVEFKNNGSGTRAPDQDLTFYFVDDQGRRYDFGVFNSEGILGAAHQFTTGHYYDDIDPGLILGISLPIDTPQDMGAVWLKVEEDPNFSIYLGKASEVPLVDG